MVTKHILMVHALLDYTLYTHSFTPYITLSSMPFVQWFYQSIIMQQPAWRA